MKSYSDFIAQSLKNEDSNQFNESVQNTLKKSMKKAESRIIRGINESVDGEMSIVSEIQSNAKSLGGSNFMYDQGVFVAVLPDKQAATDFADYLDQNDSVDSYDLVAVTEDNTDSEISLDDLTKDFDTDFEFTVYINTDYISFNPEYSDEDESMEDDSLEESIFTKKSILAEATKKVVFTSHGKTIKMMCPTGMKWSHKDNKCVKMSSQENRNRHMSGLKAAIKRRSQGARIAVKRAAAMKKRVAAGM